MASFHWNAGVSGLACESSSHSTGCSGMGCRPPFGIFLNTPQGNLARSSEITRTQALTADKFAYQVRRLGLGTEALRPFRLRFANPFKGPRSHYQIALSES